MFLCTTGDNTYHENSVNEHYGNEAPLIRKLSILGSGDFINQWKGCLHASVIKYLP